MTLAKILKQTFQNYLCEAINDNGNEDHYKGGSIF